jgi:hypothetical protein
VGVGGLGDDQDPHRGCMHAHHMRERAYNFSAHFRVERGARTVLYSRLPILSRNP